MAFMDAPDFRTHKSASMLLAGFEAEPQSDSASLDGRKRILRVPVRGSVTAFPKRHFPAIHQRQDSGCRAIFQSQY
jgi:hypothetical protein